MKTKTVLRLYALGRWAVYCVIIFTVFCVTTAIHFKVQPIMLIPVAMCIAVNETGELTAAVTGAVCGLLIDFTFGKVFGFSAVLLLFICMLTALLFKHWFRNTAFNIALICGGFTLIYVCLDFLFYYGIWGYENSLFVFLHYELPACLYTVIFAVIIHPLFKWIGLRRGSSPPARKKTPKR